MGHPNVMTGARRTKHVSQTLAANLVAGSYAGDVLTVNGLVVGQRYVYIAGNSTGLQMVDGELQLIFTDGASGAFVATSTEVTLLGPDGDPSTATIQRATLEAQSEGTNYVLVPNCRKFHAATYHNRSGTDAFLMLFGASEVPAEGAIPRASIPVPNETCPSLDWGDSGFPIDQHGNADAPGGICVIVSSTGDTLTQAAVVGPLNVTYS